ncbi:ATP-binding protein [Pseudoalteromonas xiamenensis]|uniref:ATP-binding protein n=1 Tax=Pseudoalteromonas xiamenensis TaxID=882626 RepID=UPI0027E45CBC|nr:ATP-binding protein [Pseudoalteromonas xiamenensis]WMN60195.1 ATP-binding protein [Pseudoalteromonas xiamenensis]
MRIFLLVFCLFLSGITCFSEAKEFVYTEDKQSENLHTVATLYASAEHTRFPSQFEDVATWASSLPKLQNTSLFGGRYWLVLDLVNASPYEELVLYPYNTVVSKIESRIYSKSGVERYVTGGNTPNEFAFHYGNTIRLKPGERYTLVTLLESDFFYTPTKLVIMPVEQFKQQVIVENLIMTLCFGVGIVLGLYNLLIYLGSKDTTHLFYAAFTACWVFAWSHFFHISDQLFNVYSAHLHWLGFALTPITNILFYNNLLRLKESHPNLAQASMLVGIVATMGVPFCILFPGFGFLWSTLVTGVALCLGLYIGVRCILDGFKPARYFVLAYVAMMIPNMVGNLTNLGILPPLTVNLYLLGLIGTALDAMLLAFAVADKFRLLHDDNLELNKNLEAKVLKRTFELEQLASELRDASESKSRFLANMSHEIRTPMTSIIGYADGIVLGDIKPNERNNAIGIILQNARHVLGLINDILDMSKIEANRLEVELIESNLFDTIAQVESLLGKQIRDKGLEFELKYHFPLPDYIVIDPTRLRQILLNLTSNAMKFTTVGKISIEVKQADNRLFISVKDTGIGMTSQEQKQLFTAFYQADSSTSRKYGGTGLGLNISKSLAQKLDGDIEVKSEVGSGTEFTLTLGLYPTDKTRWISNFEEIHRDYQDQQYHRAEEQNTVLEGKVLLAEDHEDNRKLISRILERMGLDVTCVENGQLAVQAVLDDEFDLILMDIQMPVMDGEQALNFILATGSSTPVIALTANTMRHEIERYLKQGFIDHLAKPIDREVFAKKVSHYLNAPTPKEVSLPEDEFARLQEKYISGLHEQKVQIQNQAKYQDYEGLGRSIHAVKGTAGMFDCNTIQEKATALDSALKEQDFTRIDELVSQLLNAIDSAIELGCEKAS